MYSYIYNDMYNDMYISWWVYFVTGLSYVLQQSPTARLAKTKADIANKSSHSCSSHCVDLKQSLVHENKDVILPSLFYTSAYFCSKREVCWRLHKKEGGITLYVALKILCYFKNKSALHETRQASKDPTRLLFVYFSWMLRRETTVVHKNTVIKIQNICSENP